MQTCCERRRQKLVAHAGRTLRNALQRSALFNIVRANAQHGCCKTRVQCIQPSECMAEAIVLPRSEHCHTACIGIGMQCIGMQCMVLKHHAVQCSDDCSIQVMHAKGFDECACETYESTTACRSSGYGIAGSSAAPPVTAVTAAPNHCGLLLAAMPRGQLSLLSARTPDHVLQESNQGVLNAAIVGHSHLLMYIDVRIWPIIDQ